MLDRVEPVAELVPLPAGYGSAKKPLGWQAVRGRLEDAKHWLATVRPDGRPHVVPVDGLWFDDVWYFGGSAATVHERNLRRDDRVVMHLEDTMAAVMVEGRVERLTPSAELAGRLAAAAKGKYGYGSGPDAYAAGIWGLRPRLVLAWSHFPADATRFRFP